MWINFWSLGNNEFLNFFQNSPISLHPIVEYVLMITKIFIGWYLRWWKPPTDSIEGDRIYKMKLVAYRRVCLCDHENTNNRHFRGSRTLHPPAVPPALSLWALPPMDNSFPDISPPVACMGQAARNPSAIAGKGLLFCLQALILCYVNLSYRVITNN